MPTAQLWLTSNQRNSHQYNNLWLWDVGNEAWNRMMPMHSTVFHYFLTEKQTRWFHLSFFFNAKDLIEAMAWAQLQRLYRPMMLCCYTPGQSQKSLLNPLCSGFPFSEDTRSIRWAGHQKKDRRVIRHQWAGPQKGRRAPKTPQQQVKHSRPICASHPSPELCPPWLRSTWRLKGRSITDDVLASAGEQLRLPVPRVSVNCTGQRSEGTNININSSHMWHPAVLWTLRQNVFMSEWINK